MRSHMHASFSTVSLQDSLMLTYQRAVQLFSCCAVAASIHQPFKYPPPACTLLSFYPFTLLFFYPHLHGADQAAQLMQPPAGRVHSSRRGLERQPQRLRQPRGPLALPHHRHLQVALCCIIADGDRSAVRAATDITKCTASGVMQYGKRHTNATPVNWFDKSCMHD